MILNDMRDMSNKEILEMSMAQLAKLLIHETVTEGKVNVRYPLKLKAIASMLNQRADHIQKMMGEECAKEYEKKYG